jgi:hypothetical protein
MSLSGEERQESTGHGWMTIPAGVVIVQTAGPSMMALQVVERFVQTTFFIECATIRLWLEEATFCFEKSLTL